MEFKHLREYAKEVEVSYARRNRINKAMEDLYWMRWDEEQQVTQSIGDTARVTRSPRASNSSEGMVRLLCAADPVYAVPYEINAPYTQAVAEKIEKFCEAMSQASNKITGKPLHYEVARSAILFDEIHILINSTKDLLTASKGGPRERQAEEIAERTPFLFKVTHPTEGFPVWDTLGLSLFYSKRKVKVKDVLDDFGALAKEVIQKLRLGDNPYREVTLNDVFDTEYRCVWIDEGPEPVLYEKHGLPFIPRVAVTVEGSGLFSKPDEQRHPALYNLWASGIIDRQNLFLTTIYSIMYAMGANPQFVEYLHNPQNAPVPDYSIPGGTIRYRIGERREPMARQLIDPALMQGWDIAQQLEMESTIYRQTLGEPLGANAPYSMVALLSQSGRLPLLMAQRMGGFAIGKAAEIALKWMKADKVKGKVNSSGIYSMLGYNEIPKQFEVEAKLDIAMPQDLLNNVNAAVMGSQGDDPLFDADWARENLLQISQPQEMQKRIWNKKVEQLYYMQFVRQRMAEEAQAAQAAMNPGSNAGGMPGMPRPMMGGQDMQMPAPQGMATPSLTTPSKPFPNQPSPFEPAPPMSPPDQGVPENTV